MSTTEVTKYEVRKYVAGAYDSDGKPLGSGAGSVEEETFDTLEEATAYFNGFDLKKEWEVEYKTSNGRSGNTVVAEIVKSAYEHDDKEAAEAVDYCDEYVGEIETVAERWYGLEEHEAEAEK